MEFSAIEKKILKFIKDYSRQRALIVGVSGGVDSGVVSTLCALSGNPVYALGLPCGNTQSQNKNMEAQLEFLKNTFLNVKTEILDLQKIRDSFFETIPFKRSEYTSANMQSRMRMVMLYAYANQYDGLVAGTGNKNEDFILYFFTKYGDGGVDFSPIGNLYKSEVFKLAGYFSEKYGMPETVATAIPTDGLWNDGRTDETQLGVAYDNTERIWKKLVECNLTDEKNLLKLAEDSDFRKQFFSGRDEEDLIVILKWNLKGKHKSFSPPVCL